MNPGLLIFVGGAAVLLAGLLWGASRLRGRALAQRTALLEALASKLGGQVQESVLHLRDGEARIRLRFTAPLPRAPGQGSRDTLPMTRLEVLLPHACSGPLVVRPSGFFDGTPRGLVRVEVEDPEFQRRFDAWAGDAIAGASALGPAVRSSLVALYELEFRKDASLEVTGNRVVIEKLSWLDTEALLGRFLELGRETAAAVPAADAPTSAASR